MKLITLRGLIATVHDRWGSQYPSGRSADKDAIAEQLRNLPRDATPEQVAAIIGNASWTRIRCDECGADGLERAVELGEEPDYENNTARVCVPCLQAAVAMGATTSTDDK